MDEKRPGRREEPPVERSIDHPDAASARPARPRRVPVLGATPTAVPSALQTVPPLTAPPVPPTTTSEDVPRTAAPLTRTDQDGRAVTDTSLGFWPERAAIPRQREAGRDAVRTLERPPEPQVEAPAQPEHAAASGRSIGGRLGRGRTLSVSWRSVGALLVAVAVAFWIGRGLFGPSTPESTPASQAGGKSVTVPKAKEPRAKAVKIDGAAIRAAGALITLNPALAQPGAMVTVSGSGFDGRSRVDVLLSTKGDATGTSLGSFKTDRNGALSAQVTIPDSVRGGTVIVTAKQWNSDKVATAEAVTAAGMGFAKLNKTTGKPGDTVSVSARGFAPGEQIKVYWGRASGVPTSTLEASTSGTVSQAPIRVGVGQVGDATLVLVGAKSGTTATVPFYMLGLYPTATATPYALKAAEQLNLSAGGFAPDEKVLIYVNTSSGRPAMTAKADTQGNVGGLGFKVPFGLEGSQSLVMVGAQSRASVTSGFQVLPYTPSAQTSTYGGSPGTSLSFFAKGYAPNEVVLVYLGRTKYSPGELVTAFRVNDRGEAGAAGRFQITSGDQGTLGFTLVGRQSDGKATASVKVTPANGPVDLPPRQPYTLPPSLKR